MKTIKISSIMLRNFKGCKEQVLDFYCSDATVQGRNGSGKSRIFDAFCWCLFGKDSQGRKDYEIKSRNADGEQSRKIDSTVEIKLNVDGNEVLLSRTYKEIWKKPRGCAEEVFDGNKSELAINNVPKTLKDFDSYVASIIDNSVFQQITNPAYFTESLKWQAQREQLFRIAGALTDEQIAATNPKFIELLNRLSGKTMADYKAEIAKKKKLLNAELKDIQPRIDQTNSLMPEPQDWGSMETEIALLNKDIEDANSDIAGIKRNAEKVNAESAVATLTAQLQALKAEMKSKTDAAWAVVTEKQNEENNRCKELNIKKVSLLQKLNDGKVMADTIRNILDADKALVDEYSKKITEYTEKQTALRQQWKDEKAKQPETICPHCGQQLPDDKMAEYTNMFEAEKSKKLAAITAEGKAISSDLACLVSKCDATKAAMEDAQTKIAGIETQLEADKKQYEAMPEFTPAKINPDSVPAYTAAMKEVKDMQAKEAELNVQLTNARSAGNAGLDEEIQKIIADKQKSIEDAKRKINELQNQLCDRTLIQRYKNEIRQLEAKGRDLAQMIADIEKDEFAISEFTKARIDDANDKINSMFDQSIKYVLFEQTIEGNLVECCYPTLNGVPYGSVNTAGKINIGLSIIHVLCNSLKVSAPIFIDNAEAVNDDNWTETEGQQIHLKVAECDLNIITNNKI